MMTTMGTFTRAVSENRNFVAKDSRIQATRLYGNLEFSVRTIYGASVGRPVTMLRCHASSAALGSL